MSNQTLNRELAERIRSLARSKSLEDDSKTHQQWLHHFSREYGHSWESLISQVEALERATLSERLSEAESRWVTRFLENIWGEIPHPEEQTLPIPFPIDDDGQSVPWPNCFIGNHIFVGTEETHELVSGPVFSIDSDVIEFHGDQLLTVPDKFVFMTLIAMSRQLPTGAILDFSWSDLECGTGKPLRALGAPVNQDAFKKALWRLTHGVLVFERYGFKGPLLKFADASKSPERFRVALNPDFAKFYDPPRKMMQRVEITTGNGQRLLWSERLTTYLACRAKRWTAFRLGEWLETLVANELNALIKCLEDLHEGKSLDAAAQDITNVVLITISAETGQPKGEVTIERIGELLDTIRLVATLEALRQNGLIDLPRKLGIFSQEEVSFQLTEAGMAAGLNVNESFL